MTDLKQRMVTPRIGLLPLGHFYYWDQFPQLKSMGLSMYARLREPEVEAFAQTMGFRCARV